MSFTLDQIPEGQRGLQIGEHVRVTRASARDMDSDAGWLTTRDISRLQAKREQTPEYRATTRQLRRVQEDMGIELSRRQIAEALGTGAFDSILVNAQNKHLIQGYEYLIGNVRAICNVRPDIPDFKQVSAHQIGSFPVAPLVPEGESYTEQRWEDDRATYTLRKYGFLFSVPWEAALNDDLGVLDVSRAFRAMGIAFARAEENRLFDELMDDNPTAYDSTALFSSSRTVTVDGTSVTLDNDLGASNPLNHDNYESAVRLLLLMRDLDGAPINNSPRYLIVHTDQLHEAQRIQRSTNRPGTGNNDLNIHAGAFDIIVTNEVTTGRWYVVGDTMQSAPYELGYLRGMQTPEQLVEGVAVGAYFNADVRRQKMRHVFEPAIVDWRRIVRANV